jgi:hypothetical protein
MAISAAALFSGVAKLTTKGQELYGEAGAVAEETFGSIRTVGYGMPLE